MDDKALNEDWSNLTGMSAQGAAAYIYEFLVTLKLSEKELAALEEDLVKWRHRIALARSRGMSDLAEEAEQKLQELITKINTIRDETDHLQTKIAKMQRQLPGLSARERSIDPDLLLQELQMIIEDHEGLAGGSP
ncbi:MAG: chromosome partitioning protein [Treponema sp.]|nr:chromosome partitioning protein [Treponema sp.]